MNISWRGNPFYLVGILDLPLHNGVKIPLCNYSESRIVSGSAAWDTVVSADLQNAQIKDPNSIRRHLPTVCFNCHGLSLASRRGWLNFVGDVLKHENYAKLSPHEKVLAGDLVAYLETSTLGAREISHTAIVTETDSNNDVNQILTGHRSCHVVSKWGMNGEYIHDLLKSPYQSLGYSIEFFRFKRASY